MLEFSAISFSRPWAIVLAAGSGTRLSSATGGRAKQFLEVEERPLFWLSARTFNKVARLQGIVFVFPEDELERCSALVRELATKDGLGLTFKCVAGGPRRQDSVKNGLEAVPFTAGYVLVHDAARPFFTPQLANAILDELAKGAEGVIPGIAVTDTIKQVDAGGNVTATPARDTLRAVQTPQGFDRMTLLRIHRDWKAGSDATVTDDAALLEAMGTPVTVIEGEAANMKITNPADLALLSPKKQEALPVTGFGYDVHRYGGNRPLVLGGVPIQTDITVEAHSDGDVLLHALMDAILGLAGAGDIGTLFPDSDAAYDGISSAVLLSRVLDVVRERGVRITHVDLTVVAQKPRLAPQRPAIAHNVARLLSLAPEHVGLKATTEERLGFTGELLGIKAYAVVSGIVG